MASRQAKNHYKIEKRVPVYAGVTGEGGGGRALGGGGVAVRRAIGD